MNRKRDLNDLGLLYEGLQKLDDDRIDIVGEPGENYFRNLNRDRLLRTGKYDIQQEHGDGRILFVKKINGIPGRVLMHPDGNVTTQGKHKTFKEFLGLLKFLSQKDMEGQLFPDEDEQSSALGQKLADKAEDEDPVLNLKDNFNYEDEEIETEFQQELDNDENEESMEGKIVSFTTKPSLDQIRAGVGIETYKGKVVQDLGDSVLMDVGVGLAEIPKDELNLGEEDAEDLGPNQQPESWGDEAMGSEEPGQTSQRFAQNTPDDPASGGSPHIDDPDEQEEDDMDLEKAIKVINKHLKARVHGDESHASKEVRDAKKAYIKDFVKKRKKDEDELGQAMAYKKITGNEVKKESYNSHGDKDMTLLAENYLNIKHHE
jgi:hypothetical protein